VDRRNPDPSKGKYIPALSFNWLTSSFDLVMRVTMRELAFKTRMIKEAGIQDGQRVLDIGCGTATLTILIKKMHPGAEVIGLDGDPKVLEIAGAKIARAGMDIKLERGMAFELTYPDGSFDRVLSSLMFHHLSHENKKRTLAEVFRILKPGGEIHIADFGKPGSFLMYLVSLVMGRLEQNRDNVAGLLPEMAREAGFNPVEEHSRFMTLFGSVSLLRGRKP
jgi:ubiquinone/menaquinone biosynthesis C-methylase UbiE